MSLRSRRLRVSIRVSNKAGAASASAQKDDAAERIEAALDAWITEAHATLHRTTISVMLERHIPLLVGHGLFVLESSALLGSFEVSLFLLSFAASPSGEV